MTNIKPFIKEFADSINKYNNEHAVILSGLIDVDVNYPNLDQNQGANLINELLLIPIFNEHEDALIVRTIISISTKALLNEYKVTDPSEQIQCYNTNLESMMKKLSSVNQ